MAYTSKYAEKMLSNGVVPKKPNSPASKTSKKASSNVGKKAQDDYMVRKAKVKKYNSMPGNNPNSPNY